MPAKTFSVDFETSGFRRASRQMSQMGDEADDTGSSLQTAGKVGAAAIGAITTAVTGAVAGIAKLTSNATEYARQVDEAASQSGIAAERIQEIAFAAEQTSGADFDTVRDGLKELALRSEEAARGTGEAKEAFDALGISQEFLEGASTAEIFSRVRQELQGASARMRTFAAETIFGGEAGERLTEVLGLSEEQMQSMSEQARATGSVMSGEQVQALEQTRMAWTRIWATLRGVGRTIATAMLPIVQRLTPIVQRAASNLQRMFAGLDQQAVGSAFDSAIAGVNRFWRASKSVAGVVVSIWNQFVSGISQLWREWGTFITEQAQSAWENVISVLRGAFGVVVGLWDTLIGTLTGNWPRAWAGIKQVVTSAVLTISQAIVGLVESVLNTLAELTSRIPGVGDTISAGLESARQSVESFRESIQEANAEASGLQDVWEGFSGGGFGGGGAGGAFPAGDGGPALPGQAATPTSGSPGASAEGGALMHWIRQIDRVKKGLEQTNEKTRQTRTEAQQAGEVAASAFNSAASSIGDVVTGIIEGEKGFEDLADVGGRMVRRLISEITALIVKLKVVKPLLAGIGIGTGGAGGLALGGLFSTASVGGAPTQPTGGMAVQSTAKGRIAQGVIEIPVEVVNDAAQQGAMRRSGSGHASMME